MNRIEEKMKEKNKNGEADVKSTDKYTEILPFLELKGPFWELLYIFLQVLQKDNLA